MALRLPLRAFGSTGMEVSAIQLGTVKIGRAAKLPYPDADGYVLPDDRTVGTLLETARELGVNSLDTAPAYGTAEARLGKLLGHAIHDMLVFTKTGEIFDGAASRYDFSAAHTRQSVQESLSRLGTDSLAGVALHCPSEDMESLTNSGALEELHRMKDEGHIRSVGASTTTLAGGLKAAELCDYVMVAFNAGYRDQEEVIRKAADMGRAVIVKKGFNSGNALDGNPRDAVRKHLKAIFGMPGVSCLALGTMNAAHLTECAQDLASLDP
ncbi:MAG: aldo/keto reductase [Alphaproteobacteria bacterium]|nr:aldo/keto reductase [Alphaproteobacteria bacterium]